MQLEKGSEMGADPAPGTGLRHGALGFWEVLAQSVSAVAPSSTATLTVPLVAAMAGSAGWLAYALAMGGMLLVAVCLAMLARQRSSPGSIYTYVRETLPAWVGVMAAWALVFAYVATAASVTGGFLNYSYALLGGAGRWVPAWLLAAAAVGLAGWVAARDVKVSAELMLWIEVVSVLLIAAVLAAVLWRFGSRLDWGQLRVRRAQMSGVRLAVMLALFSFVGFESATALGEEAKRPLVTIPRAVLGSALLCGLFFCLSAYAEGIGFLGARTPLGESTAPLREISARLGMAAVGPVIDVGVWVSMFACALACVTAASRVLLRMALDGHVGRRLAVVDGRHQTPVVATWVAALATAVPVVGLAARGSSGADIYGWLGTLAVFGFLTVYALAAAALPLFLYRQGRLGVWVCLLSAASVVVMGWFLLGTVYPAPPAPARWFPYVYLGYLGVCGAWYGWKG